MSCVFWQEDNSFRIVQVEKPATAIKRAPSLVETYEPFLKKTRWERFCRRVCRSAKTSEPTLQDVPDTRFTELCERAKARGFRRERAIYDLVLAYAICASKGVSIDDFHRVHLPAGRFPDGRIYSYACRTAVDPFGGSNLGQVMATHFNVTVRAYHRRTYYGDVVRDRADGPTTKSALATERATKEGQLLTLSPDYEAIPHPGLGSGVLGLWGGSAEGTNDYSLWPTAGAVALPVAHSSPAGQPAGFATITP